MILYMFRNNPTKGQTGSGIYTSDGVLTSFLNPTFNSTKLLTAKVPVAPVRRKVAWSSLALSLSTLSPMTPESEAWLVFNDNFTSVRGEKLVGGWNKVCHAKFCCLLFKNNATDLTGFRFGAFTGQHAVGGRYYLQTCLLSWIGDDLVEGRRVVGNSVRLAGTFTSPHVYPQALRQDGQVGEMEISSRGELVADLGQRGQGPLTTLGLLSRLYELDSEIIEELMA